MRSLSLAIRLFANMLSGHILVHIISNYGSLFLDSQNFLLLFIVFLLLTVLNIIEYFIAIVQSFVFVILSSIYFNDNL